MSDWSSDVCSSHLIAETPVQQVQGGAGVAHEFLVERVIGGVAARRIEIDARGGIIAAHLDAEVRGKRQFGAARHAAVAIAIALAAAEGRGDRRNAVGGEALTAEAPADRKSTRLNSSHYSATR